MDLVIRGGTVVTAENKYAADVGVEKGKIAQIGGDVSAAREIDASGKLVIPGGVDVHTHLERSDLLHAGGELREDGLPRMVDDYYAGTAGAAIGGVTTIGNMVAPEPAEPIGLVEMLERSEADALANSMIDFTFHPTIYDPSPEAIAELPRLAEEGYTSIKVFTLYNFDNRVDDFINVIDAAGRNGILTMVHCEDQPINQFLERRQIDQGSPTYAIGLRPAPTTQKRSPRHAPSPSPRPSTLPSTSSIFLRRRLWTSPGAPMRQVNRSTWRPDRSTCT